MKKILAVILSSMMLLSAAGCKGNTAGGTSSGLSASAQEVSSASSAQASASSTGGASASAQASASSGAAQTSGSVVSGQSQTAVPKVTYKISETTYKFQQGKKDFRVEYPQITGSGNYSAVNSAIKQAAMKTVDSIGTANTAAYAQVRVSDHVAYSGVNTVSVEFQETVRTSPSGDNTRTFRSVNYDLKNSKSLSTDDIVQKNGAFTAAIQNTIKKQMSPKKQQLYTTSVIASGLSGCSVYFKDDGLGVSLPVSAQLNGHVELKISYQDTSGFRTSNAVWSNFVKT